jgi:hypothetical protein
VSADWQAVEAIFTAVGAVAAGGGVLYAAIQYQLDRKTRREAARAQAAAERAREEATWPYVIASPVPELSDGQVVALLIKNYGQTAAYNVTVTVPDRDISVPLRRNDYSHGYTGQHELPLASTTLGPGQGFVETARVMGSVDPGSLTQIAIEVKYDDSNGHSHDQRYTVRFGEVDRDGVRQSPVVSALGAIEKVLGQWAGADGRSLVVETPDGNRLRVFGEARPRAGSDHEARDDHAGT